MYIRIIHIEIFYNNDIIFSGVNKIYVIAAFLMILCGIGATVLVYWVPPTGKAIMNR